ncbi:hypothetical protein X907_2262 [Glycocaulis alkaliphilus]|uniref:Uncharacterized protein n=1 Tax=Glycocaulis alkaliphilus TaxID=1434191 RepID=A0A3T0EBY6_9PROT|nr:hypothetical protein [Glycocaulis alkaliphilus]AZU04777.1 hypothetical protein X907_2262 [Glycocaulis alkaliphilus]GGB67706.1 hypothetical protein GCM10007417_04450 [Glycocaulis alkaliphilus]
MEQTNALARLEAIHDAVKAVNRGPGNAAAWFAAYALTPSQAQTDEAVADMQLTREALKSSLGGWRAPTGDLLWIYAALLASHGKTAQAFLKVRDALREDEKASRTRKLHEGGSRAALVLTLADATSAQAVRRFFSIKQAILPSWWRANPEVTDLFAASHAARDESGDNVQRQREAAMAVFEADQAARGLKREGARLSVLYQQPANEVLSRFLALREAVKAHRKIRYTGNHHIWMEWAAQGVTPADLPVIEANMEALSKVPQTGAARLRLAQLVWLGERTDGSLGALAAMSAMIAAQTMAIIAITSATTAVVATSAGR